VIEQIGDGRSVYENPASAFVASFVGENNAFTGRITHAVNGTATLDTPFGTLRGRNPQGLKTGDEAVLFVRPEALRVGANDAEIAFESQALNLAYEGNMTHLTFRGPSSRPITVTVGHRGPTLPGPGATTQLGYDAHDALVLPAKGSVS
jgi:spermidine/putrescine transport system ATP-binding protein